nr:hypothetical protein [Mycoplasmopsis bovis]
MGILWVSFVYTANVCCIKPGHKNLKIEKAFEKEELKPYYDFIWENIKLADKVDKPRILSKNEALEKAKEIIKHYQNNFGWEFKSDEF